MKKNNIKLAVIRSNEDQVCPFGLDITHACKNAGMLIDKMYPLDSVSDDDEKLEIANHNNKLFLWRAPTQECKYAGKIIDDTFVQCTYKEADAGIHDSATLKASPLYRNQYNGIGMDDLFIIPMSDYKDTYWDRGSYNDFNSLEGRQISAAPEDDEEIKK